MLTDAQITALYSDWLKADKAQDIFIFSRAIEAAVRTECEARIHQLENEYNYLKDQIERWKQPCEANARDAARLDWVLSTLSRRRFQCDIGIRDRIHDGSLQMTDLELPPEDSRAEALRLIDQVLAEPELDPSEQGEYALTVSHVVRLIALARQSHLDTLAKRGLVLVPKEPTDDMLEVGYNYTDHAGEDWSARDLWFSMLAAATEDPNA